MDPLPLSVSLVLLHALALSKNYLSSHREKVHILYKDLMTLLEAQINGAVALCLDR